MAVLNKSWGSTSRVSPAEVAVVTGMSESESEEVAEAPLMKRPLLVYVPDNDAPAFDKAEKVVLMDDKVCIAMWAFDCVKMSHEDALADEMLAKGTDVPRFYVIDRDYGKVKLLGSKDMSAKKLYSAMKTAASKSFKQKLDKSVKGMLKILNEFDKLANERKILDAKRQRNDGEMDARMERDIAELDEREREANETKAELLKFELKGS